MPTRRLAPRWVRAESVARTTSTVRDESLRATERSHSKCRSPCNSHEQTFGCEHGSSAERRGGGPLLLCDAPRDSRSQLAPERLVVGRRPIRTSRRRRITTTPTLVTALGRDRIRGESLYDRDGQPHRERHDPHAESHLSLTTHLGAVDVRGLCVVPGGVHPCVRLVRRPLWIGASLPRLPPPFHAGLGRMRAG